MKHILLSLTLVFAFPLFAQDARDTAEAMTRAPVNHSN